MIKKISGKTSTPLKYLIHNNQEATNKKTNSKPFGRDF